MATHPQAIIIGGEPPFNIPRLILSDTKHREYIPLNEILYLKGDCKSTKLYFIDPLTKKLKGEHCAGVNLGYFDPLLEYRFGRVNQSYTIRLEYVRCITSEDAVILCVENPPTLLITETYRWDFYYKMEKSA